MADEYWVSRYGERYDLGPYSSREEAIAAANDLYAHGADYYVGKSKAIDFRDYCPSGDAVIETMAEALYNDVGEIAEDWPIENANIDLKSLTVAMRATILAWLHVHGLDTVPFFRVVDVESHVVP